MRIDSDVVDPARPEASANSPEVSTMCEVLICVSVGTLNYDYTTNLEQKVYRGGMKLALGI